MYGTRIGGNPASPLMDVLWMLSDGSDEIPTFSGAAVPWSSVLWPKRLHIMYFSPVGPCFSITLTTQFSTAPFVMATSASKHLMEYR